MAWKHICFKLLASISDGLLTQKVGWWIPEETTGVSVELSQSTFHLIVDLYLPVLLHLLCLIGILWCWRWCFSKFQRLLSVQLAVLSMQLNITLIPYLFSSDCFIFQFQFRVNLFFKVERIYHWWEKFHLPFVRELLSNSSCWCSSWLIVFVLCKWTFPWLIWKRHLPSSKCSIPIQITWSRIFLRQTIPCQCFFILTLHFEQYEFNVLIHLHMLPYITEINELGLTVNICFLVLEFQNFDAFE